MPSPEEIAPHLEDAYSQKYFSNFGPACRRLESEIANKFSVPGYAAVTVTNATSGLHVALESIDVNGKCVALPNFTFPATFQSILAAGATPFLCDVDIETGELSATSLQKAIDSGANIAAVVHVRCFGFRRDTSDIAAICATNDIPLLYDSAAGLGDDRQPAFGSAQGEIEVFSLHATKVFAAGEGGVVLAKETVAEDIRKRTNFGLQANRTFTDGANAKMDEFRCAVALATLSHLPELIRRRSHHAAQLSDILEAQETIIRPNPTGPQCWCNYPIYSPVHNGDELQSLFAKFGIDTKRYYYPLMSNGYSGTRTFKSLETPNAQFLEDRMVCLPVYAHEVDAAFFTQVKQAVGVLNNG